MAGQLHARKVSYSILVPVTDDYDGIIDALLRED
jgi:hypothetical protein